MDMGKRFDLLLEGGQIVDGTGKPVFTGNVGVKEGRIAEVGQPLEGESVVNVSGMIVCQGFVDIHNHADHGILAFPGAENYVMQGVTTSVVGNCGLSMAPVDPGRVSLARRYLDPFLRKEVDYGWEWKTGAEYFRKVSGKGIALNIAPLVGHGTIRIAVKGFDEGIPTEDEMERMKGLLAQSLDEGAFGLSSGLIYPPGSYASSREIEELAGVLEEYGAFYATHMRNEGERLLESLEETIAVGERKSIRVQVSHLKAVGSSNWGKVEEALRLMEAARERGVDVNCDVYPYQAGMTTLTALLPPRALEGGVERMLDRLSNPAERRTIEEEMESGIPGWENWSASLGWGNIVISECDARKDLEGLSLEAISRSESVGPTEALFNLLLETGGNATMLLFGIGEEDLRAALKSPLSCIASDSWVIAPSGGGKPHPRGYGTFPRFLRQAVRERNELSWEEALRKITSMPAEIAGIENRGKLKEGFWADMVVFDPDRIGDRATFQDPHQFPEGIRHVMVNGEWVVKDGEPTGHRPGKVLRRGR